MHALHERHLASRPQPASRATRAAQTGDAAARTPAVALTPAAAALAVAAATDAQGRRRALAAPFESSTPRWVATRRRHLEHRLAPLFAGVRVGWCAHTGSAAAAATSARRPRAHLAARGARETQSPACEVKSGSERSARSASG